MFLSLWALEALDRWPIFLFETLGSLTCRRLDCVTANYYPVFALQLG